MKIALASDVHLEFGQMNIENVDGADVLVLSGDIMVAEDLKDRSDKFGGLKYTTYHAFFEQCSSQFKDVIYVMGNHEHYHGDYATTADDISAFLKQFDNVTLLDNEHALVDDIMFFGGTLWTDMNKEDPITLYSLRHDMNDFRCVMNSQRVTHFKDSNGKFHTRPSKFCPEDALEEHKKFLHSLDECMIKHHDKKFVVVGHHAPSELSVHAVYKSQHVMNGAYRSDLSDFILDRPNILLWTHGHVHDPYDYMIGATRVVCNPRGYKGYEAIADNFKLLTFEV